MLSPGLLWAQFSGGSADGATQSDAIQLDLEGVPAGVRGLYAGGSDDGFASESSFASLGSADIAVMYLGGRGDGEDKATGSISLSGQDLAVLYGGGEGDGYSFLPASQSLQGQTTAGLYSGGDGDGYDQIYASVSLEGAPTSGWYGGGDGDGFDRAITNGTLGEMLMLYGGGQGDGFDLGPSTTYTLGGKSLQALYDGGDGDGATYSNFAGVVPLPLTLISFEAFPEETYVLLRWVTENEVNTDFFTIEKTRSGREFSWVGEELAAGYSFPEEQLHYELKDYDPYTGTSFYRLKTTDFDGRISLSHLVEVNYNSHQADWGFTLYPNPNTGQHFNVQIKGIEQEAPVVLEVFDIQGRLVQRIQYEALDGQAELVQLQQKLPAGSYLIRLTHPEQGQQAKILIVGER